MLRQLAILLLMVGIASAFISVPSCAQVLTASGANFTVGSPGQLLACPGSTASWFGITVFDTTTGPNYYPWNSFNATHAVVGYPNSVQSASTPAAMVLLPTSGNYAGAFAYSGSDNMVGTIADAQSPLTNNISTGNKASETVAITDYNTTHYQVSLSGGQSMFVIKGGSVILYAPYINGSTTKYQLYWPYYTTPTTYFFNTTSGSRLNIPRDVYIGANPASSPVLVYSDFKIGNSSIANTLNHFQAVLYYQSAQLKPLIVYEPGSDVFPNFYNPTDGTVYLKNNTVEYVFDTNLQQWFVVPALSVTNFNDKFAISVLFNSQGGSNISAPAVPLIPIMATCQNQGSNYVINTSYSTVVTHTVVWFNGTLLNSTSSTSNNFTFSTPSAALVSLNYTVNGVEKCTATNETQLLPFPQIRGIQGSSAKYVTYMIFTASMAISTAFPFAVIFPVFLSDTFQLLSADEMALLAVLALVVGVLAAGYERMNIKNITTYFVVLAGCLSPLYVKAGISNGAVTGAINSLQNLYNGVRGQLNLVEFTVSGVTFIINFFIIILTFPLIAVDVILQPVRILSPVLYTPLSLLGGMVAMAGYLYLLVKIYEVLTNKFRDT